MWLLLLFIVVPVLEIWLFIIIGGAIGTYITLSIILLTAILGTFLVKAQGIYVLKEIQGKLNELKNPTEPIVHGAMILFAGALLLTPGFFTDSVGFLLLIPNVRAITFAWLKSNLKFIKHPPSESQFTRDKNYSDIEITDYKEVQPGEPSPWSDRNN